MLEQIGSSEFSAQLVEDIGMVDFVKLNAQFGKKALKNKALNQRLSQIRMHLHEGSSLIASGIEESNMVAQFWVQGIRYFQGYFIQEPGETMDYSSDQFE